MHREGKDVKQLFQADGKLAVTSVNAKTGERYLALFNISDNEKPLEIKVALSDLGISGKASATDMWTGKAVGKVTGNILVTLAPHSCRLFSLK